jgi:Putative inner membrane protein (DUF1819)
MANSRSSVVSSYTIIKGALIEETYAVFRDWDFEKTPEQNLDLVRRTNSVGAKSASWLVDIYKVLHRRFDPEKRDRVLVDLAQQGCPLEAWKPLLLWHMTRDEFLLRDFLVEWLYEQFVQGTVRIRAQDLWPYLGALHDKGLVSEPWKESTLKRVSSELLKISVEFGLMRGTVTREFASFHMPDTSFLYLLHALKDRMPNARDVVHAPDWRLFLMDSDAVERELFRLHQFRRVHYEVAGSLAQLNLPCASAAAYAREMVA